VTVYELVVAIAELVYAVWLVSWMGLELRRRRRQ
jgi:hypothetical protein